MSVLLNKTQCMRSVYLLALSLLCSLYFSVAQAAIIQADLDTDIASTKHNLSAAGPGTLKASTETRICVFCHTPHGGTVNTGEQSAPLWNRSLTDTATYQEYTSPSLQAVTGKPSGSSRMCLSCHDGALVIGNVNYAYGTLNKSFAMTGTDGDGTMTSGPGEDTGFTRNLDTNLTNDHPISFTFDSALATADSELRDPTTSDHLGNRVQGQLKHIVPLEDGKVQCISCHDPHIPKPKFLRLNRTQSGTQPTEGSFDKDNDIVCVACHEKKGWANSAHANTAVADEVYTTTGSDTREFTAGIQVWQAACLNCHDTHTVAGARMLLREGTDGLVSSNMKQGGKAAQEQTCYQCHNVNGGVDTILVGGGGNTVPDIKSEFSRAFHKPISNTDQSVTDELHRITTADFEEDQANLGLASRHAECTDCHNPHRIIKNNTFNADPTVPDGEAHHDHTAAAAPHNNIASGALAGTWGVEPIYGSTVFGSNPTGFDIKKGYGGPGAATTKASAHVTREYQICLKCHSNFAYGVTPPSTGPSIGLNEVTQYTNQAMEFQSPVADKGENSGAIGATANHRSWHPVMEDTGRTIAVRGGPGDSMGATIFNNPWQDNGVDRTGVQTMYCSDCHGSAPAFDAGNTATHSVEPATDAAWGPHGSDNQFILKGKWDTSIAFSGTPQHEGSELCFRCHNVEQYSPNSNANSVRSGFATDSGAAGCGFVGKNLHVGHANRFGGLRCTWCHAAVPHGWQNKALLVNLWGDPEGAGLPTIAWKPSTIITPVSIAPYYQKAYLGGNGPIAGGYPSGVNWRASGEWTPNDCGGGTTWMTAGWGCGSPQ